MRHRKLKSLLAFLILLILDLQQTIRAQDYSFTTIAGVGPSSVEGTNNASRFRFPQSILADDSGNLTVLDIGNASIRRLNRQGTNWISSTILGAANGYGEPPNTPYAGFSHSQGLAFGQGGSFYIGDLQRLRKAEFHGTNWTVRTLAGWIPDNGDAEQPPGGILFSQITDLARHPDGTLLIADGSEIRAFSEQGTNVTIHTIARNASLASFRGVAVNALGAVFATIGSECTVACISHEGTNWVQRTIAGLAGVSGTTDGAGSEARFDQPEGIAVDSAGNLYVADRSGQTVRKVLHSGTNWVVTTISGSSEKAGFADGIAIAANLFGPSKVSTDGAGHVFVADSINDAIRELVPVDTNWIVRTIAGNEPAAIGATSTADRFVFPEGIAVDEAGMVYVADTDTWTIKQIHRDGETRRTRIVAGVPGVLVTNNAQGIDAHLGPFKTVTLGPNHRLYTVDGFGKIRQLVQEETNWTVTTIVDFPRAVRNPSETNFPDSFFVPGGLAADQLGNLYASLPTRGSIYRISPDAGQWKITKIAYLGEYQTPVTGVVPYGYPLGLTVTPDGQSIFVTDEMGPIRRLIQDISGTNWTSQIIAGAFQRSTNIDGPGDQAGFQSPAGITLDQQGRLYVVGYNSTVRRIDPIGTNWIVRTIGGIAGTAENGEASADGIGGAARFGGSTSIAVDHLGNIYTPDVSNCTIWMGQPIFPSLNIGLSGASPIVSWPSWAVDFSLEGIDALGGTNAWTAADQPNLVGDQYVQTNKPADSQHFFRLRQN